MVLGHDILSCERTQDIQISENVSFDSMLLSPNTLKGLKTSGFYVPSPIQLHGIPLGKCGFDLLLEAKSGTGKTAVFSVIALEKLDLKKGVQTLVLAPTREIASQICDVIKTIGSDFLGLSVEVVMGGLPFTEDVEKFKKKVHIVVGSPGRLHHLISQKHIDVSSVRLMVLDEADKLVEKSFLSDINYIFSVLPSQKQIIMSSATYPEGVKTIMSNYVQNPHHICPDSSSLLLGIEQNVLVVPCHDNIVKQTKNRYAELNQLLSKKQFKQCLVFCNYQVRVSEVQNMLKRDKWPVDKLHGKQEQADRLGALKILQDYQCRILVTTDLAARGIDASNVDLVVNFEIPHDWQTYLHRIGRAGRFGSYGSAITILLKGKEEKKFKAILGSINIPFNLKYLWSNKKFLLDNQKINEDISNSEDEPEMILGEKETSKPLSDDSTLKQEMYDIPTFEILCDSFKDSSCDKTKDNIESFSDLMSSFQNHEIKIKENLNYKPVTVNKTKISSTIFNSSQNHKSCITLAEGNTNCNNRENENYKKLVNYEIESKYNKINSYYSELGKPSHKTGLNAGNTEHDSDSNRASIHLNAVKNKTKSCKSKLNGNQPRNKHHQSETAYDDDAYLPSTSGGLAIKNKTESCKSKLNGNQPRNKHHQSETAYNNHAYLPSTSVGLAVKNKPEFCKTKLNGNQWLEYESKRNEKSLDESDSVSYITDYDNASEHSNNCMSPEHNEDEKSMLALNLPTAFGKQNNSMNSRKHINFHVKKKINQNKKKTEYQAQLPKNRTLLSKSNAKQQRSVSDYESTDGTDGENTDNEDTDDENTDGENTDEELATRFSFFGSQNMTRRDIPHPKTIRKHNNSFNGNNQNNGYRIDSSVAKERHRQFDIWYQKLQVHMQMVERSVYIEVMSNPGYY